MSVAVDRATGSHAEARPPAERHIADGRRTSSCASRLQGLRTRRLRAALSALGIAIGIGAMVAVVGVSASSQANLLATIDSLGTNLLTVTPGQTFLGANEVLPDTAVGTIKHMGAVQRVSAGLPGVGRDGAADPVRPVRADRRHRRRRGRSRPAERGRRTACSGPLPRRGQRQLSRRSCSAPRPPARSRSTNVAGHVAAVPRRHLVHGDRDPQAGDPRSEPRLDRVHRAARRRAAVPDAAEPVGDLRARERQPGHARSSNLLAPTADPQNPTASRSAARPTRSRRAPRPRASSPRCCSGWARWRCWSARSGSRTSW